MSKNNQISKSFFNVFLHGLYILSFCVIIYFLADGFSYYRTPYSERPRHDDYRELRLAGFRSHGLGVIGSAMMILMLSYSLRKRVKFFRGRGALSRWLDVHIYFGITGPLLVVLHTSFKVQGLVAVSFWSMIAVALSGILGRYLYLQIPRNIRGEELNMKEIEALEKSYTEQLKREYGLDATAIATLDEIFSGHSAEKGSALQIFFTMIGNDILRPFRKRKLIRKIQKELNIPAAAIRHLYGVIRRKALLHRRVLFWSQVHRLFHYWHVIHKPFAVIMYLIMLVHIGVAVWLGYTWIF